MVSYGRFNDSFFFPFPNIKITFTSLARRSLACLEPLRVEIIGQCMTELIAMTKRASNDKISDKNSNNAKQKKEIVLASEKLMERLGFSKSDCLLMGCDAGLIIGE